MEQNEIFKAVQRPESKGWILDIMNCIDELKKNEFSLSDLWGVWKALHEIHPKITKCKTKDKTTTSFYVIKDI